MSSVIKVEQTLHGYANGHQLIAASVKINAENKRLIDELSDLSGICEEKNFIDYYTGYPIDDGKKYVIAKTWYAYEKQRPGCVWTHSLILDTEDIRKISCMRIFEKLFTRPRINDYNNYTNTILYENIGEDIDSQYDMEKLQYVIYTLFSSAKPRYVHASEVHLEEELLFMVKKMPSRLLQQFSFCTMAYDIRKIGEKEFSYQVIDQTHRYKIEREMEKHHICEGISMIKKYPLWVDEYYKYIQEGCLELLHEFMEKYGEVYMNFSDYSALARLYFAVKNTENITLIDYINYVDIVKKEKDEFFYNKTIELILDEKLDIFKGKEYEIWDMFELKKMKLKDNYQKKLNEKTISNTPEKVYPILKRYIEGNLSTQTQKVVEKLIMDLKPEHLSKVSKMNEDICVVLISQNSSLLLSRDIWKKSRGFQQMILSASSRNISDEILKCLIYIIMKYDKESIAESIFTIYGDRIIPYIYEVIKKDNMEKDIDIEKWRTVLLRDQKKLLKNILYFSDTMVIKNFLLAIDTYQDENLYAIDCEVWKKLYKKVRGNGKLDEALAVQFLPIVLKTNYLDKEIVEVISPIYEALKNNNMNFEQWNRIQALLPQVEVYQNWDRCLRVRLALKKKKGDSSIIQI